MSGGRRGMSTTFGESTSGKLLDLNTKVVSFGVWSLEMVQRCGKNTYGQGKSRRGERR
jgi:hypothetical protein